MVIEAVATVAAEGAAMVIEAVTTIATAVEEEAEDATAIGMKTATEAAAGAATTALATETEMTIALVAAVAAAATAAATGTVEEAALAIVMTMVAAAAATAAVAGPALEEEAGGGMAMKTRADPGCPIPEGPSLTPMISLLRKPPPLSGVREKTLFSRHHQRGGSPRITEGGGATSGISSNNSGSGTSSASQDSLGQSIRQCHTAPGGGPQGERPEGGSHVGRLVHSRHGGAHGGR